MKQFKEDDLIAAHKWSFGNEETLKKMQLCGCFYCLNTFSSAEIEDYIEDKPYATALCPYCEIDSVIGEVSGFPISKEFLQEMYDWWFGDGITTL